GGRETVPLAGRSFATNRLSHKEKGRRSLGPAAFLVMPRAEASPAVPRLRRPQPRAQSQPLPRSQAGARRKLLLPQAPKRQRSRQARRPSRARRQQSARPLPRTSAGGRRRP